MTETWATNGYGICVDSIKFTQEKLEELISKAPEFEKELKEYFEEVGIDKPSIEDYFEYDEYYHGGIAFILKRVIEESEGIEMCYADNYNGKWYLLLLPSYPWNDISEKYASLTEDKIKNIMQKYVSILSEQEIEPGYECVEQCG